MARGGGKCAQVLLPQARVARPSFTHCMGAVDIASGVACASGAPRSCVVGCAAVWCGIVSSCRVIMCFARRACKMHVVVRCVAASSSDRHETPDVHAMCMCLCGLGPKQSSLGAKRPSCSQNAYVCAVRGRINQVSAQTVQHGLEWCKIIEKSPKWCPKRPGSGGVVKKWEWRG